MTPSWMRRLSCLSFRAVVRIVRNTGVMPTYPHTFSLHIYYNGATGARSLLPTEEESSTEKVGEQTSGVVHLGENCLMALRTGNLNRTVPQRGDRHCVK